MSSGKSFFEAALRSRALLVLTVLAAVAGVARDEGAQVLPPPPDNPGATPTPAPRMAAPRLLQCPRCGYLCDPLWHYCIACGWDLTRLIGDVEEARLQATARSSVGVVVGGRRHRYATAFPFGGPDLYVTNARVLVASSGNTLQVRTYNNRELPATLVGYDLPSGVGLIRATVPGAESIEVAPASPAPSEPAWAVCYPIALQDDVVQYLPVSLHRGQVTATGQTGTSLVSLENLLRTDHTIEDGCNGGSLIDSRGRLAGMIVGSPDAGITYALPLEGLDSIVQSLGKGRSPERSFFGMGLVMPDERRRVKFDLKGPSAQPLVAYLIPGSPAATAGVRPGDILLAVGDQKVTSVLTAGRLLLAVKAGAPGVVLTLQRAGGEQRVTVQPVERPERILLDPIDELQETLEANLKEVSTGPGAQQGLLVADLVRGGRGEKEHFKNGDLIVSVEPIVALSDIDARAGAKKSVRTFQAFDEVIRSQFKKLFSSDLSNDRQYGSSYVVRLEVRAEGQDKVERDYINWFPDILAPPVY
jgi:S1-C subfamily serine protease